LSAYPRGYQRWVIATKAQGAKPNQNLVNFATRYRFAGQLNRIELLGSSETTQETYLLALRLALGYSALEQLEIAIGARLTPLKSPDCASAFRSDQNNDFRHYLTVASSARLQNRLSKLAESTSDQDIRPIIEAIRHTMFHGGFNPSGTGLRNKSGRALLSALEQVLFDRMNTLASEIFTQESLTESP
jgi:hypothetical protein